MNMNELQPAIPQKIKAVAYCRFSSDLQHETSIEAQKRFITGFTFQNNYEILHFYCDRARSGKNMNRPAFQQMLADSKKGDFQAIIVHKMDRFSRNLVDMLSTIDELKGRGIYVISAYEHLENDANGRLMLNIISSLSEYYISNLGNEVLKGQRENAYQCKANGGIGCLGYNIVNQKYLVNEKEAEAVRLIFQMYANGYGYNTIIDRLNFLGYHTKAGRPFGKNSIYAILNNEKYNGTFVFNKIAHGDMHGVRNSHKSKSNDEIIRVPGGVPAIISMELWDRVQAMRKINPKGKSRCKHFYLLSGLIYCGECGCKMHGNPHDSGNGGPIYITYRCNRKDNNHACYCKEVRRDYVEGFVIEELFRHFFNDNSIPLITRQLNEKLKNDSQTKSEEYLQYESTLKLLEKSRANLVDAIKQTGFNKSIGTELKNTDDQIEKCKSFIKKCEDQSKNVSIITEEQISENLDKLKEFAKTSHREEVRAMIQNYVERVTVYNDRVEVTYKVAFLSSGDSLTYHCDSSISRNNLNALGASGQLAEKSKGLQTNLHNA